MGSSYHFNFRAPLGELEDELEEFLREVEEKAKELGFGPTAVLNAEFDTPERKQFARRLTPGLLLRDARLRGANVREDGRVWDLDKAEGTCRVPPSQGVVLVISNEQREETVLGFFRFPETIEDAKARVVAETGLLGAWYFEGSVASADPRYRELVGKFAEAGYLEAEREE